MKNLKNIIQEYKDSGKKVLYLPIKQVYFDAILSGEKKQEFREVRPTNVSKYIELDEEDYEREDENGNAVPIQYDALHLAVGYRKDRDEALVEVESTVCEMILSTLVDEDGNPILFEGDEDGRVRLYKVDEQDQYVRDKDGNPVPDDTGEGLPMRTSDGTGYPMKMPVEYEYAGKLYVEEQVIYNLGRVIATNK